MLRGDSLGHDYIFHGAPRCWLRNVSTLISRTVGQSGAECGKTVQSSPCMVKVSDHGRHVMSSSPVPLKTHHAGERCTLNMSRAETSFRWCDVVVRRGDASSDIVHIT
ncbi:hypothetical protein TNCV_3939491 [Trichonephila clavipes]|uniref:Uncharacterized protein n=1 Tax=Trichonephila clavipes TaxID=2585209 RepID=A0A8X7B8L4_TRICX|nr:hypothetical protein TNCV_3939491 [Trichonephila clavipes]